MSSVDSRATMPNSLPRPPDELDRLKALWRPPRGWRAFTQVNNTAVGLWYIGAALLFLVLGGILALIMRTQLAVPGNKLVDHDLYNQWFTMHGSVMMFLFAVPVVEAIGILLLPAMQGARDLPFPSVATFSIILASCGTTARRRDWSRCSCFTRPASPDEDCRMQHRFTPTTLLITGGLLVWIAVFTFLYVFAARACARSFADLEIVGLPLIPTVTTGTALIAAAINVRLLQRGRRSYNQSSLDEHSRFIGFLALTTSAIGLVALVLLALPAFLVKACAQP